MNTNKALIGCGISVIVLLVLAVAGVLLVPFFISSPTEVIGMDDSTQVFLVQPVNGSKVVVNKPVAIFAEATSLADLQKLDLWVDNHLWETGKKQSLAGTTMNAHWTWTPDTEGDFTLAARTTDNAGAGKMSNTIHINVVAEGALPLPPVFSEDLGQLKEISDPTEMVAAGGGEPVDTPADETIPPPPPFPPEENPPADVEDDPPSPGIIPIKFSLWAEDYVGNIFTKIQAPAAPKIWASISGCDVTLIIQDNADNEGALIVSRVGPGGTAFAQIAKLDPHAGTGAFKYLDAGVGKGKYVYMVTVVNAAGNSISNMATVQSTENACLQQSQTTLGLTGATIVPTKPVTKMYCYLSVNGGSWTRIPSDMNSFIYGNKNSFDFSPYLGNLINNPPAGGVLITLDCWGWDGGTLVHLGKLEKKIEPGVVEINSDYLQMFGQAGQQQWMDGSIPTDKIAPPYKFKFVTDTAECGSLKSFCQKMAGTGSLIVKWDWVPHPTCICKQGDFDCFKKCNGYSVEDIEGFNIYYAFKGSDPVPASVQINPSMRIGFVKPIPLETDEKPGFYVKAFKGVLESEASNIALQNNNPYQTIELNGLGFQFMWETVTESQCANKVVGPTKKYISQPKDSDYFLTGKRMFHEPQPCVYKSKAIYRTKLMFDLSNFSGVITKAVLGWDDFSVNESFEPFPENYGDFEFNWNRCYNHLVLSSTNAELAGVPLLGFKGVDLTVPVSDAKKMGESVFAVTISEQDNLYPPTMGCAIAMNNFKLKVNYLP
jgi:hypothetical protein